MIYYFLDRMLKNVLLKYEGHRILPRLWCRGLQQHGNTQVSIEYYQGYGVEGYNNMVIHRLA